MDEFEEQIVGLLPRLRRFAASLAGNLADGDDLVQSALERALKSRETYNSEYKLESWMFRITQNIWIDQKRAESRRGVSLDIEEQHHIAGEDGRVTQEQRNMTARIMNAIAGLPEGQRLVVAHVLVDGQSYSETAALLDIPVGTVMSRLARARKILESQVLGAGGLI